MYAEKKLDLSKIKDYCMTSKPWLIVNENKKSCNNNKNLSQNQLQNLSPIPKTHKVPDNIYLIFAMHKFNN